MYKRENGLDILCVKKSSSPYSLPPSPFFNLILKGGEERILLPQTLPSLPNSFQLDIIPQKLDILGGGGIELSTPLKKSQWNFM